MYYAGNDTDAYRRGVGIIVSQHLTKCVTRFTPESDGVVLLIVYAKPLKLNVIQVYAPGCDKSDEEIEEFYADITKVVKLTQPHELNFIMEDFNAKVGNENMRNVCGSFGLGLRSSSGDRLVEFCQEENVQIMNTCFKLPPCRLYRWTSPQNKVNRTFSISVKKACTYPRTDIPTDHNLLLPPSQYRVDLDKLTNESSASTIATEINARLRRIETNKSPYGTKRNCS
ncbi:craniofacial development protein 2-like [Condylostylus longicornis]|uniref:craniofacial development protein 2-like n=1 Tax=Condylostylus longicornis TaxID=2530218 RepID=UPI00244E47E1|nr:craniofacial development protein 2-like [Condylostylus longicornis]